MVTAAVARRGKIRKTRKALLTDWRHREIIQAARRIFARLGYAATNVEGIAAEAGIAKGTIYLYFPSKEAVFAAVLASDLEALTNQTIDAMSGAQTFEDRLRLFLNLRLTYYRQNQDFLRIYFAEFGARGSRSPLISHVIDKLFRRGFDFMRQCLEQAIATGELRAIEVEPAAYAIFDLARGLIERHLHGWAHLPLEDDLSFTHSMILDGLRRARTNSYGKRH